MRADQRKFHYIYKITREDGKFYVGMHSTDDLEDGYFGSGMLLWKSIKKHGKEKHSKEILEFLPSRALLKARERELVNEEIVDDPLCMNLQLGGGGGDNGSFKRLTFEQKSKASKTSWVKNKDRMKVPFSPQNGENNSMFGKKHSEETRLKQSASHIGEKNSQYGTCWVTNDQGSLKIKKEELNGYLQQGFRRGRK